MFFKNLNYKILKTMSDLLLRIKLWRISQKISTVIEIINYK